MIIKNYEDLATVLGAYAATEDSISRSVYKNTSCGAWAHLETNIPKGRKEKQNWKVDIRKNGKGFRCLRARRARGKKWYAPQEWPKELVEYVSWDDGLDSKGYILDKAINDFLRDDVPWNDSGRPSGRSPYFDAEIEIFKGKWVNGVSFGSIVEGIDPCTEVQTVSFPCDEQEIWDALRAVEDGARDLWMQTHGCEHCWDGQVVVDEWGNEAGPDDYGFRPVDPDCPKCNGQGVII